MKKLIEINQRAECNSLLGKPDNLVVYIILYYGLSNDKRFTVKDIISEADEKFSMELTTNKVNYVLKSFVDKDIIRKNIKDGIHKYYLHERIYIPSHNTPIPVYQLGLLVIGLVFMFLNFVYVNNSTVNWMGLTFFGTLLLVVVVHQFMFDYKG